jgi:BirA family biotin operon repressor/biotin-[acetyl-CoA-carboxylase] ligase
LVALKWPNDVWLRGRKAAGIIAEAVTDTAQGLKCVLLGIGLNVNLALSDVPPELRDKATSVRIATGHVCDRIELASTLCNRLHTRYMEVEAAGFETVRPAWERYSALTGKRVTVTDGDARIAGVVRGIDNEGALMLDTDTGVARILTGDVGIEGAYD